MDSANAKAACVLIALLSGALLSAACATPAAARDLALYGGTQFAGATAYGELPCNAEQGLTSFGASGGVDVVKAPLGAVALQMRADAAYAHIGPAVRFRAYGPIVVTVAAQAGAAFMDYDAPAASSDAHLSFQFPVAVDAPLVGGVGLTARYRPAAMRINGETEVIHMIEGGLRIAF